MNDKPTLRGHFISQLRRALGQLETPNGEVDVDVFGNNYAFTPELLDDPKAVKLFEEFNKVNF